jgi:uncharacterized membrane protein YphA (DoxX/SURF4 family)
MAGKEISQTKIYRKVFNIQLFLLVLLRMAIGWHFLYEGLAKLFNPNWTAAGYLSVSKWIFAGFFHWIAEHPTLLKIVDIINIWGLILIGLGLLLGLFTRIASISGLVLLALYYIANPPLLGMDFGIPAEGSYLIVNKNLIELIALIVISFFPTGRFIGLDRFVELFRLKKQKVKSTSEETATVPTGASISRREIIRNLATVPVMGAFVYAIYKKIGWESYEEKNLQEANAVTSATIKTFNFSSLKDLQGKVPHAKIMDLDLSRMILGGNLIGGWAHARDLIYVSKLIKSYHHDEKVFETFLLAEKCGINTILTNPLLCRVINQYWKRGIGKIQFISDCGGSNLSEGIQISIDNGASACYVHGGMADAMAKRGEIEAIGRALDLIRRNKLPAGIGAHDLNTVIACVDYGLQPDFWMKTLHHVDYWSSNSENQHDNIWCVNPEETIEYMRNLPQPWIAYKTLAAGAIHPSVGFKYAFENGADFICVGMYDFQLVDDVNIVLQVLNSKLERKRQWFA